MKKDFMITNNIDIEEKKRIAEIKSLSYLERLERLMILIEVSDTLREVNRIQYKSIKYLK